jgi:hypothetical protein
MTSVYLTTSAAKATAEKAAAPAQILKYRVKTFDDYIKDFKTLGDSTMAIAIRFSRSLENSRAIAMVEPPDAQNIKDRENALEACIKAFEALGVAAKTYAIEYSKAHENANNEAKKAAEALKKAAHDTAQDLTDQINELIKLRENAEEAAAEEAVRASRQQDTSEHQTLGDQHLEDRIKILEACIKNLKDLDTDEAIKYAKAQENAKNEAEKAAEALKNAAHAKFQNLTEHLNAAFEALYAFKAL